MTPGDPTLRKAFDRICRRTGGEPVPHWLARVAHRLKWTTARTTSLYKDRRCVLSAKETDDLRSTLSASPPAPGNSLQTANTLSIQDMNELKRSLKIEIYNEIIKGFTRFVEVADG